MKKLFQSYFNHNISCISDLQFWKHVSGNPVDMRLPWQTNNWQVMHWMLKRNNLYGKWESSWLEWENLQTLVIYIFLLWPFTRYIFRITQTEILISQAPCRQYTQSEIKKMIWYQKLCFYDIKLYNISQKQFRSIVNEKKVHRFKAKIEPSISISITYCFN